MVDIMLNINFKEKHVYLLENFGEENKIEETLNWYF